MRSVSLLFKVLWSPGEAMFLLSKTPRVVAPLVFLSLMSLLTGAATVMKLDTADMTMRAIERSPRGATMTDDQKQIFRRQMSSPVVKVIGVCAAVIGPIMVILIVAAIYFVVFTMLGREGGFKAFLSITAFAFVPSIFRQLAVVLSAYTIPAASIMPDELGSLSPAVFVDRDALSPAVFAAINSIDLISIWILSLLVIGYGFLVRKSLSQATRAAVVVGVFLVYVVLRMGYAAISGV